MNLIETLVFFICFAFFVGICGSCLTVGINKIEKAIELENEVEACVFVKNEFLKLCVNLNDINENEKDRQFLEKTYELKKMSMALFNIDEINFYVTKNGYEEKWRIGDKWMKVEFVDK